MSTLYDLLKEKATNPSIKDKIVYVEQKGYDVKSYSYEDLYTLVNKYINYEMTKIKNLPSDRKIYFVVDNSINAIVAIIACLRCNLIPIVYDYKNVDLSEEIVMRDGGFFNKPFTYDELLIFRTNKEKLDSNVDPSYRLFIRVFGRKIEYASISSKPIVYDSEKPVVVICSSGSVDKTSHFHALEEAKLLSNENRYGESGSIFLSYITCGNISGILTNIVNPLTNDTKVVLTNDFDMNLLGVNTKNTLTLRNQNTQRRYHISKYNPAFYNALFDRFSKRMRIEKFGKILMLPDYDNDGPNIFRKTLISMGFIPDSVMLPRDIDSYLSNFNLCDIDLSNLKHIYLSGGSNSYDTITTMRRAFPSIRANVFENLYGSTETYGMISSCKEDKLKTCYIDVSDYKGSPENIVYTYDLKDYYRVVNGSPVKVDMYLPGGRKNPKYSRFLFTPYLPVSEGEVEGLLAGEDLSLRFKQDYWHQLNDLGAYFDGKLYILSRKSELIMPKGSNLSNYQIHFLCNLEEYLRMELRTNVYCINSEDGVVQIFIDMKDYKYEDLVGMYRRCLEISCAVDARLNLMKIDFPVFLNSDVFPISKISGKLSKGKLSEYGIYAKIQSRNILHPEGALKLITFDLIKKLFEGYYSDTSNLDSNGTFIIGLVDQKFLPITESLNKVFDIVKIDDARKSVTFRIKPTAIFVTDEEIFEIKYDINQEVKLATFRLSEKFETFDIMQTYTLSRFADYFLHSMVRKIRKQADSNVKQKNIW